MTVNDYISQKFQTFGINLSEADLLEISLSSGISGEDEMKPVKHRIDFGGHGEVHPLSITPCNFHQRERFLYVLGHQGSKGILLVSVQEVRA